MIAALSLKISCKNIYSVHRVDKVYVNYLEKNSAVAFAYFDHFIYIHVYKTGHGPTGDRPQARQFCLARQFPTV